MHRPGSERAPDAVCPRGHGRPLLPACRRGFGRRHVSRPARLFARIFEPAPRSAPAGRRGNAPRSPETRVESAPGRSPRRAAAGPAPVWGPGRLPLEETSHENARRHHCRCRRCGDWRGRGIREHATEQPPRPGVRPASVDAPAAKQLPPGVRPAPVDAPTAKQLCRQAEEQFRQKHPEGYSGGCNSGSGTLTIP